MHCNFENYESDALHEIDVIDPKKYRNWTKKYRDKDNDAFKSYYDYTQPYFCWKIKNHKLIYFVFKPILCFLHFHLIKNIILKKNSLALIALLSEASAMFFIALYCGLQISLFVCIGFACLYALTYYAKTIFRYYDDNSDRSTTEESEELKKINQESDEQRYMLDFKHTKGSSYIINFIKKNYIAIITFLFEATAITFTALYFSLQIGLFVFVGFGLFYTLICAVRKIVNYRAEPKISTDTELDDDNASASVNSKAEEKIPLSENNLQKGKN